MQKHELDSAQKLYGLSPVLSSLGTEGRFTVFTVVGSCVDYSISTFNVYRRDKLVNCYLKRQVSKEITL